MYLQWKGWRGSCSFYVALGMDLGCIRDSVGLGAAGRSRGRQLASTMALGGKTKTGFEFKQFRGQIHSSTDSELSALMSNDGCPRLHVQPLIGGKQP